MKPIPHRPEFHLVRTGRHEYVPTRLEPGEKFGAVPVAANQKHREALQADAGRRKALVASIARGYAKHLGLSMPVAKEGARAVRRNPQPAPARMRPYKFQPEPSTSKPPRVLSDGSAKLRIRKPPTSVDVRALETLGNDAAAALRSKSQVSGPKPSTGSIRLGPTSAAAGAIGLKSSGGGGSVAGKAHQDKDLGAAATATAAAFAAVPGPSARAPKTGTEFHVSGVEVTPEKDHRYTADLRPAGDSSESHLLKFTQFVQTTSRGGHDVKFELTLSKGLLKTPATREAAGKTVAAIVDSSLAREGMSADERAGFSGAFKPRLNEALAKMAAE
jgi:hypothetical protein